MREQRRVIVLIMLVAAAVVAGLVAFSWNAGAMPPATLVAAVAVGALVLGAVLFVALAKRAPRGRRPSRAEAVAERLGLDYQVKGNRGCHHDFGPLPGIPRGGDVRHMLTGELDGRALTAFQHSYVVSTGQTTVPVHHTVYVTAAPKWPSLTVSRRRGLGKLLFLLGRRRGLLLEDPTFNATFKIRTDDEDFAVILLHPEMQRFLTEKPSITWRVHLGCAAMIYGGALRADRIEASFDRLRRFWRLVPAELEAW